MQETSRSNDKIILAVSFLAVLIAMYGYKDLLNQLRVFIFSYSFSLFDLLVYMSIVLCISIYFTSIANLGSVYKKLEESKLLKICDKIADYLYLVAILVLPTTFFGNYLIISLYLGLSQLLLRFFQFQLSYNVTALLSTLIGLILTLLTSYYSAKMQREKDKHEISSHSNDKEPKK
jgi:hypothetical protein